jgi:signal transduction histidine kinase
MVLSVLTSFLTVAFVINSIKLGSLHYAYCALYSSVILVFLILNLWVATYKTNKIKESLLLSLNKKNTYLEHAAKILRHDMHSGINVYMPRGVKSLERRLTEFDVKRLKLESPLKMIHEGLVHTQKVYHGVYEFTNLVKKDSVLNKEKHNIKEILKEYLKSTSYKSQVLLDDNLPIINVNQPLFCTALDNLIRNGLKYNDSENKLVKIYSEGNYVCIEDNGRGMTQKDFEYLSRPYTRKKGQKEQGMGLGLNICKSILEEHGFTISVDRINGGMSKFYKDLHKYEELVSKAPSAYVFEKSILEDKAKENNYYGSISIMKGGRNKSKIYILYKDGNKYTEFSSGTKIKVKIK